MACAAGQYNMRTLTRLVIAVSNSLRLLRKREVGVHSPTGGGASGDGLAGGGASWASIAVDDCVRLNGSQ